MAGFMKAEGVLGLSIVGIGLCFSKLALNAAMDSCCASVVERIAEVPNARVVEAPARGAIRASA